MEKAKETISDIDETNQTKQTVVITGASGGIGFYSALSIAKTGAHVIITGRNKERGEIA